MFLFLIQFSVVSTNHCGGLEPMLGPFYAQQEAGFHALPLRRWTLWPRKWLAWAFRDCSLHFLSLRLFALKAADAVWGVQWRGSRPPSTLLAELCWQFHSPARSGSQVTPQPSSGTLTHLVSATSPCSLIKLQIHEQNLWLLGYEAYWDLKVACNAANGQKILYS